MFTAAKNKPSYESFLEVAGRNLDRHYVIVDGLPRSGTNFLRNICTTMSSAEVVLQAPRHFFNRTKYLDGFLHGKNIIHLFPLRDDIMDSLYSSMVLHEVFIRDNVLGSVSSILRQTIACLQFATTQEIKNIYFLRVSRLEHVTRAVEEVFSKHAVPHVSIDAKKMVADLSMTDDPENFRSNRFPVENAQKEAEMLLAKETLSLDMFQKDIAEIKRMHTQLIEKSF